MGPILEINFPLAKTILLSKFRRLAEQFYPEIEEPPKRPEVVICISSVEESDGSDGMSLSGARSLSWTGIWRLTT